jgi:hypothetical protein
VTGTVFLPRRHGEHRGTARRSLKEWRGRGPKRPRRHLFQATFRLQWIAEAGSLARRARGGANGHGERASGSSGVASEGPSLRPPPGAPGVCRLLRRRTGLPEKRRRSPCLTSLLHRRSLSPEQLCSSPKIHGSVKPLCTPCLRGEFSRRRCRARRPAVPIATWARRLSILRQGAPGTPSTSRTRSRFARSTSAAVKPARENRM